jgi:hypothetical protein
MDISRTRVVLRERAIIDVLDLGFRFIAEHWAVYAKVSALVLPFFFGATWAIAWASGPTLAWTFAIFASAFVATPFTLLASRLVFEDEVRLRDVWGQSFRAAPKLFVLRMATFLIGAFGLAFFVIPGIWVFTMMLFVVEVLVLERAGIGLCVRRCSRIVRRESGQAVLATILLTLMHALAVVMADIAGRLIVAALLESHAPESMWEVGWSPLAIFGFWLFVPYAATARFFVYLDIRTRSEGWDIQTRFVAIATRANEETRVAA